MSLQTTETMDITPESAKFTMPTFSELKIPLAVSLVLAGWMTAYAWLAYEPTYESAATVLIKDSAINNRYLDKQQYYQQTSTSANSSNPVLNTMGLLRSSKIMQSMYVFLKQEHPDVLKDMGIKGYKDWQKFYKDGKAVLDAENETGTDLIHVKLGWNDPVIAQEALGVALKAFQDASVEVNRSEHRLQREYLESQLANIQKQLGGIRGQKSNFKQARGTVNLKAETESLVTTKILLENKLSDLRAQASGAGSALRRYESMMGMNAERALKASAVGLNGTLKKLNETRYELAEKEAQLAATLTDKNPKLKEVRDQLNQVSTDIDAETRRTLGSSYQSGDQNLMVADSTRGNVTEKMILAKAEMNRLNAEAAQTAARLSQINAKLASVPGLEQSLSKIDQEETSMSSALDAIRQKALEARVKEAQTLSNVFIVDAPRLPIKAAFPSRPMLNALGLLAALAAGIAAFIVQHKFGSQIRASVASVSAKKQMPTSSTALSSATTIDSVPVVKPASEPVSTVNTVAEPAPKPLKNDGWQKVPVVNASEATEPELSEAPEHLSEIRPSELIRPRSRKNKRKLAKAMGATDVPMAQNEVIDELPPLTSQSDLATDGTSEPTHSISTTMSALSAPNASLSDALDAIFPDSVAQPEPVKSPVLAVVSSNATIASAEETMSQGSYWDAMFEKESAEKPMISPAAKPVIDGNLALKVTPETDSKSSKKATTPKAPGAVIRKGSVVKRASALAPWLKAQHVDPDLFSELNETKSPVIPATVSAKTEAPQKAATAPKKTKAVTNPIEPKQTKKASPKKAAKAKSVESLNAWCKTQCLVQSNNPPKH
ncbi:MAG: hypothetical protein VKJ06_02045 [Vampirovibrionales bacterium]|nr:hypothetical protein [Vampirovibrionales bacterium]